MTKNGNLGAGLRIKEWRLERGLKPSRFCQLINIAPVTLHHLEAGKTNPSGITLAKIALKTDIDIRWLLTGQKGK